MLNLRDLDLDREPDREPDRDPDRSHYAPPSCLRKMGPGSCLIANTVPRSRSAPSASARLGQRLHAPMYRPGLWFTARTRLSATAPRIDRASVVGDTTKNEATRMAASTMSWNTPARTPKRSCT